MNVLALALAAVIAGWTGRLLFGTWYNHVSHYSLIWGASLGLFELRLIEYYPLQTETWILIGSAWVAFVSGSVLVPLAADDRPRPPESSPAHGDFRIRRLRNAIAILSLLSGAAVAQHWMILVDKFGSVLNVIVLGNIVYSLRLTEGFEMGVPYLDSLALTAALLGGVYTARRRRFSPLAVLPLLIMIAEGIGMMGRMKILIAVILFLSGYFISAGHRAADRRATARSRFRNWAIVGLAVVLFGVAGEIVRTKRGIEESIPGAGRSLRALTASSIITPSIYMYLTVHHGVFNQYLKRDEERHIVGANTFAPVYRILARVGMDTKVPQYTKFYPTPVNANSGSWLREIHADFGILGIFFLPFLIGLACSVLWVRYHERGGLMALAVLAHLLVVVDLSTMILGARLGYWLVSLVVSVAVAWYVDAGRPENRSIR